MVHLGGNAPSSVSAAHRVVRLAGNSGSVKQGLLLPPNCTAELSTFASRASVIQIRRFSARYDLSAEHPSTRQHYIASECSTQGSKATRAERAMLAAEKQSHRAPRFTALRFRCVAVVLCHLALSELSVLGCFCLGAHPLAWCHPFSLCAFKWRSRRLFGQDAEINEKR